MEQKEANHCKAETIFLHQVELFSGLSSLPSPNFFCCCVIAIDSPQMFVTSLVMHWTFLVPLHWSFYLTNSSETQIPKADIFSSAFNNKIAELFFFFLLKRTNFLDRRNIWTWHNL